MAKMVKTILTLTPVVACATRDKNRLRAVLLESCPALEAAVDLSDRRWLELLAGFGGAWGIARSGAEGPRADVSANLKLTTFANASRRMR